MEEVQLNFEDWERFEQRIESRLVSIHDIMVSYVGDPRRANRIRSSPDFAKWQAYELIKSGMSPGLIGRAFEAKYPEDYRHMNKMLDRIINAANREYSNSSHHIEFKISKEVSEQARN